MHTKILLVSLIVLTSSLAFCQERTDREKINDAGDHINLAARNLIGGFVLSGVSTGGAVLINRHTDVPGGVWKGVAAGGNLVSGIMFIVSTVHFTDAGYLLKNVELGANKKASFSIKVTKNRAGITLQF